MKVSKNEHQHESRNNRGNNRGSIFDCGRRRGNGSLEVSSPPLLSRIHASMIRS